MKRSGKAYKDRSATARAARRAATTPAFTELVVAEVSGMMLPNGGRHWQNQPARPAFVIDGEELMPAQVGGLVLVAEKATYPTEERDWPKFLGMAKSIAKLEDRRHVEQSEERFGGEWSKQNPNADGLVRKGRKFGDQAGVVK